MWIFKKIFASCFINYSPSLSGQAAAQESPFFIYSRLVHNVHEQITNNVRPGQVVTAAIR